jgi:hypothetical protein
MSDNTVLKLMSQDNIQADRQQKILKFSSDFIESPQYRIVIGVMIRDNENAEFKLSKIPILLLSLVKCFELFKINFPLQSSELKYVIFAIIVNFILTENRKLINEDDGIPESIFIDVYDNTYDVLVYNMQPLLSKVKTNCTC